MEITRMSNLAIICDYFEIFLSTHFLQIEKIDIMINENHQIIFEYNTLPIRKTEIKGNLKILKFISYTDIIMH